MGGAVELSPVTAVKGQSKPGTGKVRRVEVPAVGRLSEWEVLS